MAILAMPAYRRPRPLAWNSSLHRFHRVRISCCGWMTRCNEGIDQRFAFGREGMLQCGQIVRQLRLGARSADDRGYEAVVEHPGHGELAGTDATCLGVGLQLF